MTNLTPEQRKLWDDIFWEWRQVRDDDYLAHYGALIKAVDAILREHESCYKGPKEIEHNNFSALIAEALAYSEREDEMARDCRVLEPDKVSWMTAKLRQIVAACLSEPKESGQDELQARLDAALTALRAVEWRRAYTGEDRTVCRYCDGDLAVDARLRQMEAALEAIRDNGWHDYLAWGNEQVAKGETPLFGKNMEGYLRWLADEALKGGRR